MSELKFYVSESIEKVSWEEDAEFPDVSSDEIMEDEDFSLEDINSLLKERNYSEIEAGTNTIKNTSHDNHDKEYFEEGIEKVHSLSMTKITKENGEQLDDKLASKVWSKVVSEHCADLKHNPNESDISL